MSETNAVNGTEKKSNRFDLILRAVSAALLVVATIICAGLTVYFGNESEFPFEICELCFPLFICGLLLFFFLLLVQFPFKKTLYFCIANYLVFCIGICLYFQSNWFLWDLGPLMAGEFWWDWAEHGKNTIIESGLYIVLIALFIGGRKWLYKNLVKLSFAIIAIEIICLSPMALKPKEDFSYMHYTIDESKKFEFAKDQNVIICVLDCYTTPLLEEIFRQYPSEKEIFNDFTMYTRHLAKKPFTQYAVPAIMTGKDLEKYDDNVLKELYLDNQNSLLLKMNKIGFNVEIYPCRDFTDGRKAFYYDQNLLSNLEPNDDASEKKAVDLRNFVYSVSLRLSPLRLKGTIARLFSKSYSKFCLRNNDSSKIGADDESDQLPDNVQFYRDLKSNARLGESPLVFKYYHLKGVHFTFDTDEDLNPLPSTSRPSQTKESYINQARGCIKLMRELVEQLKKCNSYDNSIIVFMGDHGRLDDVFGIKGDIPGDYNPMLLVKMVNERHSKMQMNSNVILQTDICMMPFWNSIDSVSRIQIWGSDFDKKQIEARNQIWKEYQNKQSAVNCQFTTFKQHPESIDFSNSIILEIPNPVANDSELTGELMFNKSFKYKPSPFYLFLVNANDIYSTELKYDGLIYYNSNISSVPNGKYKMYYMASSKYGNKIVMFPHCEIQINNGKAQVLNIEH